LLSDAKGLSWILALYAAIHIPIDYIGGYWLPCHFSRQCLLFPYYAAQYFRGLLVQSAFLFLAAMALLQAGRWGGRPTVLLLLCLMMLLMVETQVRIAMYLAGLRISGAESINGKEIVFVSSMDSGFSGGISGLPGRERLIVPLLWQKVLPNASLGLAVKRRLAAVSTGSRRRGLLLAIGWNLFGFLASSMLPGAGVTSLKEFFTTSLWFTLWSFLGLLLLPTFSRQGVFELDHFAKATGTSAIDLALTVRELDQLQDDEPLRPLGVEMIFHPVPSVESRLEHFRNDSNPKGAWNAARYALFLSWPCLGFLNRAVHCNSGRPELWVMLPVD